MHLPFILTVILHFLLYRNKSFNLVLLFEISDCKNQYEYTD